LLLVQATEAMLTYRNALLGTFPDGVVRRDGLVEVVGSIPARVTAARKKEKGSKGCAGADPPLVSTITHVSALSRLVYSIPGRSSTSTSSACTTGCSSDTNMTALPQRPACAYASPSVALALE
jgi:hypothetical protein